MSPQPRCRAAPAPRFQLYVRFAAPCRARGGSNAPVSFSGASVAQGAVCGLDACTAAWLGDCRLWLGQRCWPALVGWRLLCVPLVVPALVPACLCIPNHRV